MRAPPLPPTPDDTDSGNVSMRTATTVGIICGCIALIACVQLSTLSGPLIKSGFAGMGYLTLWLVPLLLGFVLLEDAHVKTTKEPARLREGYVGAVFMAWMSEMVVPHLPFLWVVKYIVGFAAPLVLIAIAIHLRRRHVS